MTWNEFVQTNLSCSVIIYFFQMRFKYFSVARQQWAWVESSAQTLPDSAFFFFSLLTAFHPLLPTGTSSCALNKDGYIRIGSESKSSLEMKKTPPSWWTFECPKGVFEHLISSYWVDDPLGGLTSFSASEARSLFPALGGGTAPANTPLAHFILTSGGIWWNAWSKIHPVILIKTGSCCSVDCSARRKCLSRCLVVVVVVASPTWLAQTHADWGNLCWPKSEHVFSISDHLSRHVVHMVSGSVIEPCFIANSGT